MKKNLFLYLLPVLLLVLWQACQPLEVQPPAPTPALQHHIVSAGGQSALGQSLAQLQKNFPAAGRMAAQTRQGFVATPWGLLDTAHVLRLQQSGQPAFYTFRLLGTQPAQPGFKRLLLYAVPGGHRALLLHYMPHASWQAGQPFQGQLQVSNLAGQALPGVLMGLQGVQVGASPGNPAARMQNANMCLDEAVYYQDCQQAVSNTTGLPLPEDLDECTWVLKLLYSPCHDLAGGAGPSLGSGNTAPPPGTFLPSNGGGSGSGSGGTGTTPPAEEPPIDEPIEILTSPYGVDLMEVQHWLAAHIDYADLPDCLAKVAKELPNVAAGPLAEMINLFDQGIPEGFNWAIRHGRFEWDVPAYTEPDRFSSCNCVITVLDNNKLSNATDIAVMATLLHEMIHAYFVALRQLDSVTFGQEFPEILDRELDTTQTYSQNQHQTIAERYHKSIAKSLKAYGDSKGLALPLSYYKNLAWEGLAGTITFNNLSDTEKVAAINTAKIEFDGVNVLGEPQEAKGTLINCPE